MIVFLWVSMATGPGVHEERLAHQAGSIRSGEYECVTMVTVTPCLSCSSFVFVFNVPRRRTVFVFVFVQLPSTAVWRVC